MTEFLTRAASAGGGSGPAGRAAIGLVFVGPPGAGKGTLAKTLQARAGMRHISPGDLLRQAVRDHTEYGRKALTYMRAGDLVPDEIVDAMIQAALAQAEGGSGWVLDGYPRTPAQAGLLDGFLASRGGTLNAVVYFEIGEDILLRRLTGRRLCPICGAIYHVDYRPPRSAGRCDLDGAELVARRDDAPDTALHRFRVYRAQTAPLIDHYRRRGLLLSVNAERPAEELYDMIWGSVRSRPATPLP